MERRQLVEVFACLGRPDVDSLVDGLTKFSLLCDCSRKQSLENDSVINSSGSDCLIGKFVNSSPQCIEFFRIWTRLDVLACAEMAQFMPFSGAPLHFSESDGGKKSAGNSCSTVQRARLLALLINAFAIVLEHNRDDDTQSRSILAHRLLKSCRKPIYRVLQFLDNSHQVPKAISRLLVALQNSETNWGKALTANFISTFNFALSGFQRLAAAPGYSPQTARNVMRTGGNLVVELLGSGVRHDTQRKQMDCRRNFVQLFCKLMSTGDATTTLKVLEVRNFLSQVTRYLPADSPDAVAMVMDTLQKHFLDNDTLTSSQKAHICRPAFVADLTFLAGAYETILAGFLDNDCRSEKRRSLAHVVNDHHNSTSYPETSQQSEPASHAVDVVTVRAVFETLHRILFKICASGDVLLPQTHSSNLVECCVSTPALHLPQQQQFLLNIISDHPSISKQVFSRLAANPPCAVQPRPTYVWFAYAKLISKFLQMRHEPEGFSPKVFSVTNCRSPFTPCKTQAHKSLAGRVSKNKAKVFEPQQKSSAIDYIRSACRRGFSSDSLPQNALPASAAAKCVFWEDRLHALKSQDRLEAPITQQLLAGKAKLLTRQNLTACILHKHHGVVIAGLSLIKHMCSQLSGWKRSMKGRVANDVVVDVERAVAAQVPDIETLFSILKKFDSAGNWIQPAGTEDVEEVVFDSTGNNKHSTTVVTAEIADDMEDDGEDDILLPGLLHDEAEMTKGIQLDQGENIYGNIISLEKKRFRSNGLISDITKSEYQKDIIEQTDSIFISWCNTVYEMLKALPIDPLYSKFGWIKLLSFGRSTPGSALDDVALLKCLAAVRVLDIAWGLNCTPVIEDYLYSETSNVPRIKEPVVLLESKLAKYHMSLIDRVAELWVYCSSRQQAQPVATVQPSRSAAQKYLEAMFIRSLRRTHMFASTIDEVPFWITELMAADDISTSTAFLVAVLRNLLLHSTQFFDTMTSKRLFGPNCVNLTAAQGSLSTQTVVSPFTTALILHWQETTANPLNGEDSTTGTALHEASCVVPKRCLHLDLPVWAGRPQDEGMGCCTDMTRCLKAVSQAGGPRAVAALKSLAHDKWRNIFATRTAGAENDDKKIKKALNRCRKQLFRLYEKPVGEADNSEMDIGPPAAKRLRCEVNKRAIPDGDDIRVTPDPIGNSMISYHAAPWLEDTSAVCDTIQLPPEGYLANLEKRVARSDAPACLSSADVIEHVHECLKWLSSDDNSTDVGLHSIETPDADDSNMDGSSALTTVLASLTEVVACIDPRSCLEKLCHETNATYDEQLGSFFFRRAFLTLALLPTITTSEKDAAVNLFQALLNLLEGMSVLPISDDALEIQHIINIWLTTVQLRNRFDCWDNESADKKKKSWNRRKKRVPPLSTLVDGFLTCPLIAGQFSIHFMGDKPAVPTPLPTPSQEGIIKHLVVMSTLQVYIAKVKIAKAAGEDYSADQVAALDSSCSVYANIPQEWSDRLLWHYSGSLSHTDQLIRIIVQDPSTMLNHALEEWAGYLHDFQEAELLTTQSRSFSHIASSASKEPLAAKPSWRLFRTVDWLHLDRLRRDTTVEFFPFAQTFSFHSVCASSSVIELCHDLLYPSTCPNVISPEVFISDYPTLQPPSDEHASHHHETVDSDTIREGTPQINPTFQSTGRGRRSYASALSSDDSAAVRNILTYDMANLLPYLTGRLRVAWMVVDERRRRLQGRPFGPLRELLREINADQSIQTDSNREVETTQDNTTYVNGDVEGSTTDSSIQRPTDSSLTEQTKAFKAFALRIDTEGTWLRGVSSGGALELLILGLSCQDAVLRNAAFEGLALYRSLIVVAEDDAQYEASKQRRQKVWRLAIRKLNAAEAKKKKGDANSQKNFKLEEADIRTEYKKLLAEERLVVYHSFKEWREVLTLLEVLKNSITTDDDAEASATPVAVSALLTSFLAHLVPVILDVGHQLYLTVNKFLCSRSTLQLNDCPTLLHRLLRTTNAEAASAETRLALRTLRVAARGEGVWSLLKKRLPLLISSTGGTFETWCSIASILLVLARDEKIAFQMVKQYCVLDWMDQQLWSSNQNLLERHLRNLSKQERKIYEECAYAQLKTIMHLLDEICRNGSSAAAPFNIKDIATAGESTLYKQRDLVQRLHTSMHRCASRLRSFARFIQKNIVTQY